MPDRILVFYGSYRRDRMGIRLADFIVAAFATIAARGTLIDAKALALPMLDRMYKEYPAGWAPPALEGLAQKSRRRTPSSLSPANLIGECSRG